MIDLTLNEKQLANVVERAREKNIIIPTLAQQKNPELIPQKIKDELKDIGLEDLHPRNLFRITWKNEPKKHGGLYGNVNYVEIPPEISGVKARIFVVLGHWFPIRAHKVGATFGCLVPQLVTGQFDPTLHEAAWPSTGNFCRGGAYNSALLGCKSIAILPEEMSAERFEWLKKVAGEIIATPGCESNVKEIFDKCWELKEQRKNVVIFNQFEEPGNHLWHYAVTGSAMVDVLKGNMREGDRFQGVITSSGSAGTTACGDFIKEVFPQSKIAVAEALQCPTLLYNGFGGHKIEGIGDKHIPWIHNSRNTDLVVAVDDNHCMNLARLFNEEEGHKYLKKQGVSDETLGQLPYLGISSICNLLSTIKMAKYYEMNEKDVLITVATDGMDLYETRLQDLRKEFGDYKEVDAAKDYHGSLMATAIDNMLELTYYEKKRIHSLKYYTWIEQQQRDVEELNAQWEDPGYWKKIHAMEEKIDDKINEFNDRVGIQ
ncbi:pyridoxal-phosphate dependent enzyme [Candidatus Uabimicrobium sp. HlEnr_7]|uniref:pyridoxal-phosphate dependent enzyme n=1 Tax=Candidatus Uabimicrobium helgolandensis TaxID=3095367 RepID=UPI00355701D1